jgi:hypothetical protein
MIHCLASIHGMSNGKWCYAMLVGRNWYEGGEIRELTAVGGPADLQKLLDRAGANGWELAGVEAPASGLSTRYVFKRPA